MKHDEVTVSGLYAGVAGSVGAGLPLELDAPHAVSTGNGLDLRVRTVLGHDHLGAVLDRLRHERGESHVEISRARPGRDND